MTENERDQLLIYIDTRIDKLQKVEDLLKGLKHPEDCPGYVSINFWDGEILIVTRNMEQLHEIRKYLRKEFGTWEDKISMIWYSLGANASWYGTTNGTRIGIRLACSIEEFPEELKRDGCGFKKTSHSEMSYVCEKEEPK